jgi:hypothetical protein
VAKVKVLAIYGNDFLFNPPEAEFPLNIGVSGATFALISSLKQFAFNSVFHSPH